MDSESRNVLTCVGVVGLCAFCLPPQGLLEELSNVYDVTASVVEKSGGNTSVDGYINATLWTIVFNDPVGDVPPVEVLHSKQSQYATPFINARIIFPNPKQKP